jgi:DNA-binding sugar fermentation-stimulating protein
VGKGDICELVDCIYQGRKRKGSKSQIEERKYVFYKKYVQRRLEWICVWSKTIMAFY